MRRVQIAVLVVLCASVVVGFGLVEREGQPSFVDELVFIPIVLGKPEHDAIAAIEEAGLRAASDTNVAVRRRGIATSVCDSRATVDGGSERFQAVGEAGLRPASVLLDPASLLAIRVVSGGGGIRTPEGPNGPLRFSRPQAFGSTTRPGGRCATQRATVLVDAGPSSPR